MEKKFTKGEWVFEPHSQESKRFGTIKSKLGIGASGYNEIRTIAVITKYPPIQEQEANAQLIASAPKLLEALIDSYLTIQGQSRLSVKTSIRTESIRCKMRDTIADALGIEPQEVQNYIESEAIKQAPKTKRHDRTEAK